jgi:CspA family cold shock protein
MTGVVKKLFADKGFGFIEQVGRRDVFFHVSGLVDLTFDQLKEGQAVTYDVEQADRGPKAINIRVAQA